MKLDNIKQDFIIPEKPKIDIKSIYIQPKKERFSFRRLSLQLSLSFVFLLLLGLSFFIETPLALTPVVLEGKTLDRFSVVSSSMMLEETTKSRLMSSTTSTTLFEEKIDYINPYINVFEVFFGSVGPEITLLSEGVLEGYTHYEQITYTDALNNKIVYHYHYIETIDDDEIEQKGVIIHNDETYYVEISIETEEDEIEKEYLIYKDKDRKDKDYISLEIEKDLEDGDQSYQYYIYKDGNEVHKVTVVLEQDDNQSLSLKTVVDVKNRLKFTLELRQVGDKLAGKYKIESDRVESGKVTLKIIESDGLLYYEYSISNKVIKRARSLR